MISALVGRTLRLGVLFVSAILIAASTAVCVYAATPVEQHGALNVKGNRIVDQHGKPVVLRGMSLFWSQWQPQYYNASAIRWLRDDWNITVIRAAIGVHQGGYLDHPEREMRRAETVIQAAIDLGVYVIIDWHAHEPEPEAAAAFFEKIARKYGHLPNVIYEPWNEPLEHHDWSKVIKPYHQLVATRIRAIDPDNLIVAGTRRWSQDVDKAAADPLAIPNLAYTLHFYAATHGQALRDKAKAALDKGAAIIVTEWGTSEANGNDRLDADETRRWWQFMEDNGISYVNWSVADKNETSAALKPGAAAKGGWSDTMLSPSGKLVRAHLRKINGPESAAR